ncbi:MULTISPECIES: protein kinase [unclassified Streptomyces]|uniref:protein kinase n=1 Tax=unclassified Streptomyces TaxID=2593676 RepID=UPI000DBA5569|nr:protein kinase [Streptomyces sp. PsTaAH-137]MYT68572.1 protein kinase [Streptomyces sp. SID8367]RAJ86244.1 protein kinase-like protein [Streptomyces sp. PsTaAH-137]
MDEYAGRVLADRYRLPLPAADGYDAYDTTRSWASRAFDTYSGQEVLVRQVPLPEVVEAEVLDADGLPEGFRPGAPPVRQSAEPSVSRAIEAAQAAAQIPDHPRLDQVFDVFAEGGSLWVVSEVVAARPLAALLDRGPLSPYRAAEIAADVLTALRALHAHGWVHRNITARTVLVCDDGRVVLTGLAAGAAEEALCGYDPRPAPEPEPEPEPEPAPKPGPPVLSKPPAPAPAPAIESGDFRAARAGAIAAYRAGARAAAGQLTGQPAETPAGQLDDPYGVRDSWHGATRRPAAEEPPEPAPAVQPTRWNELIPGAESDTAPPEDPPAPAPAPGRAALTTLDAERARQVRMTVVGPVTERWAPEQAYPVQESWQLAAPVGPATDLWALGALLFRAVQGHAPYPEESTPELVQMVCAEPPAFAEECGPLRPVVESLLRQDPTERLDFEELGGWLRSLVRSAPEPDAGQHVVPAPAYDATRLPIKRRRGELVRRRRAGRGAGRHKRGRDERMPQPVRAAEPPRAPKPAKAPKAPRAPREPRMPAAPRPPARESSARQPRRPRSLGKLLVTLVLLGLVGAVAYAMVFMPKSGSGGQDGTRENANSVGGAPRQTPRSQEPSAPAPSKSPKGKSSSKPSSTQPQSDVAAGFTLRKDPEGFEVAVAKGWQREGKNGRGQVVYSQGDFELLVVPGRDSTATYGRDPMKYQREDERELQPFRDSTWATSSGMKTIDVGGRTMAEGQFTWQGGDGKQVFVRNLAMVVGGKYHVVQVRGPEAERDEVSRLFDQASSTYQYGG